VDDQARLGRQFFDRHAEPFRCVVEQDAPRLLVRKIVGEKAFGGTWTFEIAPEGHEASTLTITERGDVYNPLFRTAMRLTGQTRGIDGYLAKLQAALS
jgi:hypothetical protein